jgi:hypothetical protein
LPDYGLPKALQSISPIVKAGELVSTERYESCAGGKLHSSSALTINAGIILFDTIYPYNSEKLTIGGMQKVDLDPKNIKYVLISHAHGGSHRRRRDAADSQKHIATRAAATGATVLLSNQSEFDNTINKNRMLGRGTGAHSYELGADWVQRYVQVMQGCARAAQLRLEQQLVRSAMPSRRLGRGATGIRGAGSLRIKRFRN